MNKVVKESNEQFLSGGGEMGKLIRTMDWANTALGPVENWPQSLRTSVSLCLSSTFPILIAWGPETIQIYNDSYRPICGAKHPESMGQNFRICWETALPVVGDKFTRGEQGEGTYIKDQRMFLDRYGYLEEAFMTFSFAPIRDESGGVGGIFHPITETTEKMLSGRRTQVLRDLGAAIANAKSVQEISEITDSHYDSFQLDIPFLSFYKLEGGTAELLGRSGSITGAALFPEKIDIENSTWPISLMLLQGSTTEVPGLKGMFGDFECPPYEEAPDSAMILPIRINGRQEPFGFLIAGLSARRAMDEQYLNFYEQLASTYNTAVSNVYAYEQEQKRAEALAEIDRSKTAFFSNVSHEFRTPLTLMLGPLEELLKQDNIDTAHREQIHATHRNALRLLKLVNNLLDYSRVEAGRVQAVYQPVDLSAFTTDLASSFRSIIEKAGMELYVHCAQLPVQVFVDKQMWEKIVLNLLSNAFKFTLQGSITVGLSSEGNDAVLRVTDTGVGIPEKEIPHMFERFHRVEHSLGRTHEGSGIGLSLVHELVQLHGGIISVTSKLGVGSIFEVRIPIGKVHLPAEQVREQEDNYHSNAVKDSFIGEASSLLNEQETEQNIRSNPESDGLLMGTFDVGASTADILIVDDNADMRAYLSSILQPYFKVRTATNGAAALLEMAEKAPALVLSDIMMPVMDGMALLRHIRSDENLLHTPVIFLSARAGEEARIEGLEAGADDYLVKPFSAAELLTKIRTQINTNTARRQAEYELRSLLTKAPVAMSIYRGRYHKVELANELMLDYWGLQSKQVVGSFLFDAIPELAVQGFREIMDSVYQDGERYVSLESPMRITRYGKKETLYLALTIEALRSENGHISGLIAVAADVTRQVAARQQLENANNTLRLAMDAAQMGLWRADWNSDELQLSEKARSIHGLEQAGGLSFRRTADIIIEEHRERVLSAIANAVEDKGGFNENFQIQPADGSALKWINSSGLVETNAANGSISVVGTILDITERKEDEQRKNDFISMVSHELKTPLTSLSAYCQLGQKKMMDGDEVFQQSVYENMTRQITKMKDLVTGFLDLSRLGDGKIALELTDFRLDTLITELVEEARFAADHQSVKLDCNRVTVKADRNKIGTVIINLLNNAFKYGQGGEVTIRCQANEAGVHVTVEDKGPGIEPDNLTRVFERYYRVDNKVMRHISGFGIGLYLCAEIIKQHNGRIWAESVLEVGSAFHFTLPVTEL